MHDIDATIGQGRSSHLVPRRARVTFELEAQGRGGTVVHLSEVPIGAARLAAPLLAPLAAAPNARSLQRLDGALEAPSG
ncbi:MAG: hypothetical protein U0P45_12440 [Acidimicrobiales bacterium]